MSGRICPGCSRRFVNGAERRQVTHEADGRARVQTRIVCFICAFAGPSVTQTLPILRVARARRATP
jgi:hypothetical protein